MATATRSATAIVDDLSRNEAIRGLIAHADERFQVARRRGPRGSRRRVETISGSVRDVNARLGEGVKVLAKLGAERRRPAASRPRTRPRSANSSPR